MYIFLECVRVCVAEMLSGSFHHEARKGKSLFSSFGIEVPKGANGSEVELKM